jgi:hypothetical protein
VCLRADRRPDSLRIGGILNYYYGAASTGAIQLVDTTGPAEISDPTTFILSTELALFPVPQTTDGAMMRGDPSAILGGEYPRNLGAEEEHLRGVVHPNQ